VVDTDVPPLWGGGKEFARCSWSHFVSRLDLVVFWRCSTVGFSEYFGSSKLFPCLQGVTHSDLSALHVEFNEQEIIPGPMTNKRQGNSLLQRGKLCISKPQIRLCCRDAQC